MMLNVGDEESNISNFSRICLINVVFPLPRSQFNVKILLDGIILAIAFATSSSSLTDDILNFLFIIAL